MYLDEGEGSVPFDNDLRGESPELKEDSILAGNDGVSTTYIGGQVGGALAHGDQPKFPQTSYFQTSHMSASKHTVLGNGAARRGAESIKADQKRARYLDTWLREMDHSEIKLVNA